MEFEKLYIRYEQEDKQYMYLSVIHIFNIYVWTSMIPLFYINIGLIVHIINSVYWFYLNPITGLITSIIFVFVWGFASIIKKNIVVVVITIVFEIMIMIILMNRNIFIDLNVYPMYMITKMCFKYNLFPEVEDDIQNSKEMLEHLNLDDASLHVLNDV